jgi:hypothetical protein
MVAMITIHETTIPDEEIRKTHKSTDRKKKPFGDKTPRSPPPPGTDGKIGSRAITRSSKRRQTIGKAQPVYGGHCAIVQPTQRGTLIRRRRRPRVPHANHSEHRPLTGARKHQEHTTATTHAENAPHIQAQLAPTAIMPDVVGATNPLRSSDRGLNCVFRIRRSDTRYQPTEPSHAGFSA